MWIPVMCVSTLLMVNVGQIQAPNPSAGLSTDNPTIQQKIVDLINHYRRIVQPPAANMLQVFWNNEAAENAKKWAQKCTFEHSDSSQRQITECGCGENLYMASYAASWEEAIGAFYDEHNDFIFGEGKKKPDSVVGHYTQLVWYNSRLVGCAISECTGGIYKYFYVCQHCPPGNVNSINKPYKNGTTCGDCPKDCANGLCTNFCPNRDTYSNCNSLQDYCGMDYIQEGCKGSCNCKTEII
ncbi:cysteine-rich venom protein tigrin-like [Rhinoderma darwinii]|uniref:cysteine-rich venom protein tigrin-like n=1 Tax=Rhinoderma darwinii TaxID=43563 RepID=UPI003F675B5B